MLVWEQARLALLPRYERDLASTQGRHVRFWKKVLRGRIKARVHRKRLVDDLRVRRAKNPNAILPPPVGDLPRSVDLRTVQWRPRRYNQHQRERRQRQSDANRELRGKPPYRHGPPSQQSRSRSWQTWWESDAWQPWWSSPELWCGGRDWDSWGWHESASSSWSGRPPPA